MAHIELRAARAEDRSAVLAFCQQTWSWGDYIESTWSDWLQNEDGYLAVVTADEQPVGIVHMQMLTATDAWLEGLRVDPAFRHQGLARMLNEEVTLEAMRRGATAIRMAIETSNERSIHISEEGHFRPVGTFALYSADSSGTPTGRSEVQLAAVDDLEEIIDYLNASNIFPVVGGLYYAGFHATPISEELLTHKIAEKQIYLLRRWDRLDGLAIAEVRSERLGKRLSVGYIDGMTVEAISLLAYDLRHRLAEREAESIIVYAPDSLIVHDALTGIEYEQQEAAFYTYERGLQ